MGDTRLKTLDEIAIECQTDRASVFTRTYGKPHNYAVHYDKLFTPLREKCIDLIEIGVGGGEGIRMWLKYFSKALIFGVDNQHGTNSWDTSGKTPDDRYTFAHGDQCSDSFWIDFSHENGTNWDIVIDDGLHSNVSVITSFMALWPHVKKGGFYAIEDLGVAYGGSSFFVDPRWPNQVDWLKGKIDELNRGGEIDSIYFSKELAVLRKA